MAVGSESNPAVNQLKATILKLKKVKEKLDKTKDDV
jgi:hypothetical protein